MRQVLMAGILGISMPLASSLVAQQFVGPVVTTSVNEDTPRWNLSSSPEVRIGVLEGREEELFSQVRFAGRLSSGEVVVLDGQTREVRYFDAHGSFIRRVGRRGQGPGEFRVFTDAAILAGDTLVIYDPLNRRITQLGPDGSVDETAGTGSAEQLLGGTSHTFVARMSDGRLLFQGSPSADFRRLRDIVSPGDTIRFPDRAVLVDPNAPTADTLAVIDGPIRVVQTTPPPGDGGPPRVVMLPHPLATWVLIEGADDRVAISNMGRYEIQVLDVVTASSFMIRRTDVPRATVTPEIVREIQDQYEDSPNEWEGPTAELLIGHPLGTHRRILFDDLGRLWVQDASLSYDDRPWSDTWIVFGRDGRIEAVATIPPELEVFHIGESHVTGRLRDEYGVEYVAVYQIDRS